MAVITRNNIYEFSRAEILAIPDISLREELLKLYQELYNNLLSDDTDTLSLHYGQPINILEEIVYRRLQEEELALMEETSEELFPGDRVLFYQGLTERNARKPYTCVVSGARISIGSLYVFYRPFFYNCTQHRKFVLKRSLHAEMGSQHFLPSTLHEFEIFQQKLIHGYDYSTDNCPENLYDISIRVGDDLALQELHSKKSLYKRRER